MQALNGIRVLDFSRVLAGPFCTMLLGDMGADVIKVESPRGGDDTRAWGPPWLTAPDGTQVSAYYLSVNRNKRSITLNLKTAEGQAVARQLAAHSHIVVENFKPGDMARFGLAYDDLKRANPALVYASISGFGQRGSYADRPGYDHIIQAMSGLMSITGAPDGDGYKVGVAVSDVLTGQFALAGILAALRQAEQTGVGQFLDVALLDSQLAALVNIASGALISGQTPPRYGNQHASIVPYQNFDAADGAFALAVGNDHQFASLCRLIAREAWITDACYATNAARVEHRAELCTALQAVFSERPAAEWVERFNAAGIPAGAIQTVTQALADPNTAARGLLHDVTLASGAQFAMVGSPLTDSVRLPPPALGQHTSDILTGLLGIDAAVLSDYRARGIV
jgi:crotonobetainyl-CoA:carnitine CoA-transferase CaiB-like acyl-CoA transferase